LPHIAQGKNKQMQENSLQGLLNRILQMLTMLLPGGGTLRVWLHRARGVHIGRDVFISYNVILETAFPQLITIDDGAFIGIGVIVIAHFKRSGRGVRIEKQAFIGPGAIILPDVKIGEGAVVTAGSVVTASVPPMTVVQGNPAVPIAKCGIPLHPEEGSMKDFLIQLRPISRRNRTGSKERERDQESTVFLKR
jgi:serine acetyltransferase